MIEIKGFFRWEGCKVFFSDSACVKDGFFQFAEGPNNEMLVCECKTVKLAEEITNSLNKKLTKWDKIDSLMKD
ncbi:MAG: hypothetical protein F6K48_14255 [Okeania sp. SIO3H1]|uniref:hypothetical protein n=1 Tax=Okeania sp. SIO1I7 TaxID=2607772 RepID=UPI0013CA69D8|nr:hypothetical protein [Okeania sp. SIO1I7]NEN90008.1 hypothetical protein [Okeania sp. SIO3H1]NET24977.1 hypothetical protein [Okeania sp. SIO1I7]